MNLRWIGAVLIVGSCGFVGFSLSAAFRREEQELQHMIAALELMKRQLQYRLTPLPELCREISADGNGNVAKVFGALANALEQQTAPDVQSCLADAASCRRLSPRLQQAICILGATLGRFDLQGQLQGLESVSDYCRSELDQMAQGRDARLRSYQTLGLCAGASLAILLV